MGSTVDRDVMFADVATLRSLLERGEISAVELAEACMHLLGERGVALNAVASILTERGIEDARRADRALGRDRTGPLLGVPYGAKDLFHARGGPTTYGSPAFADQSFDTDARAIARLGRAGAPLVAKLALTELGATGTRDPRSSLHGPGRNPWDPSLFAGGSSSGSGAAVAAGLLPASLGTETGGSIAAPSALCGVTGMRPTYGTADLTGVMPAVPTMDKIGPIAHSMVDCWTILRVIAPSVRRLEAAAAERMREPSSIRVGLDEQDVEIAALPTVRAALREGMSALRATGVTVVRSALSPHHDYWGTMDGLMDWEARESMIHLGVPDRIGMLTTEDQRTGMARLLETDAASYEAASHARRRLQRDLRRQFEATDVVASYTLLCDASSFPVDQRAMLVSSSGGNTALLAAGNIGGYPAVFLPVGLSENGLPVGIQLVGARRSDALLAAIGQRFQAITDWHRLRPPAA